MNLLVICKKNLLANAENDVKVTQCCMAVFASFPSSKR